MTVHLLKSPELLEETYSNVLHLLQHYRGPIKFVASINVEDFSEDEYEEKIWHRKQDFETIPMTMHNVSESRRSISFPFREKTKTWSSLFKDCDKYRKSNTIPKDDIVVLLTDFANDKNWFGGVSPSMKNYFVQTSNWKHFFGNGIDIRFPIAYEVAIWIMRFFMFPDNKSILKNTHQNPIGCIMDFCQEKSEIILKMRTADVCEKCMNHFTNRDISTMHLQQFFDILDGIRKSMTFRGRSVLLQKPSKLEIKGYTKKLFFTDLGDLELRLSPKEKALFLLFLEHPNGLFLHDLIDHKQQLKEIYSCFCKQSENELINQAIDNLVNPLDNDKDIILSRINKKIKDAVGESLMDFYTIKGEHGGPKRIRLDREMITVVE